MFANYLIGLREGLEASLVVSILVAYLVKVERRDRLVPVGLGVGAAIALSAAFGAMLTYTSTTILQTGASRETFGGTLSIVAVFFVTGMVFWMRKAARNMRAELSGSLENALALGWLAVWATAFIAVAREGLETALFFWSAVEAAGSTLSPVLGFGFGVTTSVIIAWLLYRRAVTINLAKFFTWTGAALVVVAAGVLAYGFHDLQEGGVIGGLNSLAFDISKQIPPSSWYGTLLKGTINLSPNTTWLQAIVWTVYIVPTMFLFLRGSGIRIAPATKKTAARAGTIVSTVVAALFLMSCSSNKPLKAGEVGVTAGDKSCETTTQSITSGNKGFSVKNSGSQITEVEVLASGDRVMGELENIGPATTQRFVVQLPPGDYQVTCKPGMTGDGVRQPLKVTGKAIVQSNDKLLVAAVAGYRNYVIAETKALVQLTIPFAQAVKANNIPLAKQRYAAARVHYERIEPIAESFPELDTAIDIRADGVTKGQQWTGFHRLERDIWQRGDISKDGPLADKLIADVKTLAVTVKTVKITPDELGNGARGLLDEVAKNKITGEEERYSHIDLVDFQANLDGARAAYAELRPVLVKRDKTLAAQLDRRFESLQTMLKSDGTVGGQFKSYTAMEHPQLRALSNQVDAVAEPLSHVTAIVLK